MDWGFITIFPNMYVVLIGPSGKCRKSTAMNIGADILKTVGVKVSAEAITREALIQEMVEGANVAEAPDGKMRTHCSLTIVASELMVFLGDYDPEFLANLTDWYDSMEHWTYRTKTQGTDVVRGVCLNMLGATAPDWISLMLPQAAVGGGFTSRIIFVVEERKRKIVAVPFLTEEELALRDDLVSDLQSIHLMNGNFQMSKEAIEAYVSWYKATSMHSVIDDPKFGGYCERRPMHALKISMLCSASRGSDMIITAADFQRSLGFLEAVEIKMAGAFSTMGQSRYASPTIAILDMLKQNKSLTKEQIMRVMWKDMDEGMFSIVMKTLVSMGVVGLKPGEKGIVGYEYIGS